MVLWQLYRRPRLLGIRPGSFSLASKDGAERPRYHHCITAEGGGGRRVQETLAESTDKNLAVETHVDSTEPTLDNTCTPRNLPTSRKLDTSRAAAAGGGGGVISSSQSDSPDQIRPRPVMSPLYSSPLRPTTKTPFSKTAAGKKLEPLVGMWVIMVTLVIMIMWGRLCAILCTSAWLYFVPKFRPREVSGGHQGLNSGSQGILDMDSEEYKKKVVLEGLIDRSRRS